MSTISELMAVLSSLEQTIGHRDADARAYRTEGSYTECAAWFDTISEHFGPLIAPGGVAMYVEVSRAAVYKRIRKGKLTAFLFQVTSRSHPLRGQERVLRERPFC